MSFVRTFCLAVLPLGLGLAAACGGGSGDSGSAVTIDAAAGGSVSSSDGLLTLEVPPGALSDDTKIMIEAVDAEDLPDDVAEGAEGEVAYKLEPDGLTFAEPVAVTLRLDMEELASPDQDGAFAVPVLLVQSEGGEPELLTNLDFTISQEDGAASVSGEVRHFSWVSRVKGPMEVELEQPDAPQPVGLPFYVGVAVWPAKGAPPIIKGTETISGRIEGSSKVAVITIDGEPGPSFSPLYVEDLADASRVELVCVEPGKGLYYANLTTEYYIAAIEGEGGREIETVAARVTVDASADCVGPLEATPTPTPTATPAPGLVLPSPTTGLTLPTETPAPEESVGCNIQVDTTLLGPSDTADGTRWNVRTEFREPAGAPAVDYKATVEVDKAGTISHASGTTAELGTITWSVLQVDPGTYSVRLVELTDPQGAPCKYVPSSESFFTFDVPPSPFEGELFFDCEHGEDSSTIFVMGTGYLPYEPFQVLVIGPGVIGSSALEVSGDADGNFTLEVPIDAKGFYEIVVGSQHYSVDCR